MIKSILAYLNYGLVKFKRIIWLKILKKLGPEFTAWFYGYRFAKRSKNLDPNKKTVFTYNRPQFSRDITELQKRTNFNFIVADIEEFFDITDAFIPHTYGGQINFNSDDSPECTVYKKLIIDIFMGIFKKISQLQKIDFVISANFDCSYDYGMCMAAKNLGIASFVFYYEHPTIPYARVWWHAQYDYYKVTLFADRTALWSDLVRSYLDNGKFCQPSQIVTTGAPRFDRWRNFDLTVPPKKYVVLMAYPGLEYFALCNFIDVIRILASLSKIYTNHTFFVKCKNSGQTFLTLDYLDGIPDHKLQISHDFDLVELQAHAKVIIGFNSLSILEAMLSNAVLINPCWGDANLDPFLLQLDPNVDLVNEVYHLPKSREEFRSLLEKTLDSDEKSILEKSKKMRPKRDELFSCFFFRDPNVPSCKLFERMMLETLEEKNKKNDKAA